MEKKPRVRGGTGASGIAAAKPSTSTALGTLPKLKIVVRKLPPLMTDAEFKNHTEQWIDFDNSIDFFSYVIGKVSEEYVCAPDKYAVLTNLT